MKKLSLLLLIPFFMLLSCSDDNSENPDNTNPILSLTNEQIAGSYTLSKAIDKDGKAIDYGCDFSKITYELKTDGSALHKRCSEDFDHTWKRDKDKITIYGDGIMGDGTTYSLQISSTNKKLELVTAYTVYTKN